MKVAMLIILANSILIMGFIFGEWFATGCVVVAAVINTIAAVVAFKEYKK